MKQVSILWSLRYLRRVPEMEPERCVLISRLGWKRRSFHLFESRRYRQAEQCRLRAKHCQHLVLIEHHFSRLALRFLEDSFHRRPGQAAARRLCSSVFQPASSFSRLPCAPFQRLPGGPCQRLRRSRALPVLESLERRVAEISTCPETPGASRRFRRCAFPEPGARQRPLFLPPRDLKY